MKIKNSLLLFSLVVVLTSCAPITFYQVYQTESDGKVSKGSGMLYFENEDCKVSYNLWEDQGNIGFLFLNKTDKTIELNMEESYFLLNGIAQSYFKNRVYTNSSSSGISSATVVSRGSYTSTSNYVLGQVVAARFAQASGNAVNATKGYSVSFTEQKIIRVPAHTAAVINEYSIWDLVISDCDLVPYPRGSEGSTIKFSKETSPINFSNHLSYTLDRDQNLKAMDNEFYVSEITNYAQLAMFEFKYEENCGKKSQVATKFYKHSSPERFFLKHSREASF